MAASLVGEWTEADTSTQQTTLTLAARTSTAGTLITAHAAGWKATGGNDFTIEDSKTNTWDEEAEPEFGSFVNIVFAHNMAGTRGTSHTITANSAPSQIMSLSAMEWSGVEDPAVTVTASTTGSSATPSVDLDPGAGTHLIVGIVAYDGADVGSPYITPGTGYTRGSEIGLDNANQNHSTEYKVEASTASQPVDWTLNASRAWGVIAVSFKEIVTKRWIFGPH